MQLHQMRYVVEVERAGSISRAAESLFLKQPHLSSAISDLEKELGIQLFNRTNRGVTVTEQGAIFLSYAKNIINQLSEIELMYAQNKKDAKCLRLAWSITTAHVPFQIINQLPAGSRINIHLMEKSHLNVIRAVIRKEADVGMVLLPERHIDEYERYARKQNLILKRLWQTESCILMSERSKLASESVIHGHMLTDEYIQMVYRPAGIFDMPDSIAPITRGAKLQERVIYFEERSVALEVLSTCPYTYVQTIYIDNDRLERYNLVARPQTMNVNQYVKAILYHKQPLSRELQSIISSLEDLPQPHEPPYK